MNTPSERTRRTSTSLKRSGVLTAFMEACPEPTAEDVRRWTAAHPDHLVAIGELAAALVELSIYRGPGPLALPTRAEYERADAKATEFLRSLEDPNRSGRDSLP